METIKLQEVFNALFDQIRHNPGQSDGENTWRDRFSEFSRIVEIAGKFNLLKALRKEDDGRLAFSMPLAIKNILKDLDEIEPCTQAGKLLINYWLDFCKDASEPLWWQDLIVGDAEA